MSTAPREGKERIYYFDWVSHRKENYNIQLIIPEDKNSQLSKDVARGMLEDEFYIDIDSDKFNDNTFIDATFNLEVSKKIAEELEKSFVLLFEQYKKLLEYGNAEDVNEKSEEYKKRLKEDLVQTNKMVKEEKRKISRITEAIADKDKVNQFLKGIVWYETGDKKTEQEKKQEAIAELSKKDTSEVSLDHLSEEERITASQLIDEIDKTLVEINDLLSRYELYEEIEEEETIEETKRLDEIMGKKLSSDEKEQIDKDSTPILDVDNQKFEPTEKATGEKAETEAEVSLGEKEEKTSLPLSLALPTLKQGADGFKVMTDKELVERTSIKGVELPSQKVQKKDAKIETNIKPK